MQRWLFKSEPFEFSWDNLCAAPDRRATWDGVRNYQARNLLRQARLDDLVLFYHSSVAEPHIMGVARIAREAFDDPAALNPDSPYFDPRSTPDQNRWSAVEIQALYPLDAPVTRTQLKNTPRLADMLVLQRGQRLSIQPVSEEHFQAILDLGGAPAERLL